MEQFITLLKLKINKKNKNKKYKFNNEMIWMNNDSRLTMRKTLLLYVIFNFLFHKFQNFMLSKFYIFYTLIIKIRNNYFLSNCNISSYI